MANHVRYIRKRANGMYYYERRLPKAAQDRPTEYDALFGGKALFRESLRTRNQSEALAASEPVHADFERRLQLVLGGEALPPCASDNATRRVTPARLVKITEEACERVATPWRQALIRAELGPADQAELERMVEQREWDAEHLRAVLLDRAQIDDARLPDLTADVARLIEDERLDAPAGSNMYAIIMRAVREGQLRGQREIDAMLSGSISAIPQERPNARRPRAPKISEVLDAYIGQLRAPRTIREAKEALSSFISVIGDIPLDEISRADVVEFCKVEGARVIGGKTSGSVSRPMSPSTLKKKIGLLRAAINHATQVEMYAGPNPAAKIDARHFTKPVPKALMPDKRPFTVHELQLLVNHPWFTGCESDKRTHEAGNHRLDGMHFWVPILAMHTGCRAGELGGLRVSEIRLDHQHPHVVIQDNRYRTTKGSYRRSVPLLDVLLDLGFGHFVERVAMAGHDRLFFDWQAPAGRVDAGATAWANASLIRSFNRTVVPQQLGSLLMEGARQEVTFHSFRGAFKTLLGRSEYNLPENYKHEVIGHAKSALDKRYVQEIPLADTYPAIKECAYRGLVLPPAPGS
ncbi:tyrosine-type recombinase/integrase [Qipengyuania marisflavi]|uniref:Core-binding (CB) domain-containing protein n=1 Tax=Qipengyuania marisflavi TaxID=2486356 RepID=A0A5S3P2G8_9SPHN|nr:tyrosine-type recombinase/integrase [Qipengyuania marisflavi]TMM46113.1 hypothetical protein FEV51_11765 [Qipengyuania marisflavi]